MTRPVLNVCLDLNVWCAAFLADQRGMSNTACQSLVRAARLGRAGDIPVQMIISWGMLTRLRKVMEIDWALPRDTVDPMIEVIAGYARLGAHGWGPHLTLGGMGVWPLRDEEDAHVLETALAGRADILVTANFDDFLTTKAQVLEPGKVALVETVTRKLLVVHPYRAAEYLRNGGLPLDQT